MEFKSHFSGMMPFSRHQATAVMLKPLHSIRMAQPRGQLIQIRLETIMKYVVNHNAKSLYR